MKEKLVTYSGLNFIFSILLGLTIPSNIAIPYTALSAIVFIIALCIGLNE